MNTTNTTTTKPTAATTKAAKARLAVLVDIESKLSQAYAGLENSVSSLIKELEKVPAKSRVVDKELRASLFTAWTPDELTAIKGKKKTDRTEEEQKALTQFDGRLRIRWMRLTKLLKQAGWKEEGKDARGGARVKPEEKPSESIITKPEPVPALALVKEVRALAALYSPDLPAVKYKVFIECLNLIDSFIKNDA